MLELNWLLRPGGYFAYASPEAYAQDEEDLRIWKLMSELVELCAGRLLRKETKQLFGKSL